MAEQTNFYAVLRAVPRSFKPESQIYTFASTSTETVGEVQIQFSYVPYVKLTLAMDSILLNSMREFITLKKKQTRKGLFCGEYTNFLTKG